MGPDSSGGGAGEHEHGHTSAPAQLQRQAKFLHAQRMQQAMARRRAEQMHKPASRFSAGARTRPGNGASVRRREGRARAGKRSGARAARKRSRARRKVHACPIRRTFHNAMRAYCAAKCSHDLTGGCPSANSQRNCPLSPQFPTHSGRAHNCQHNHQPTPVTHIPASSRGSGTTPVRPPVRQRRDSLLPNPTVLNMKSQPPTFRPLPDHTLYANSGGGAPRLIKSIER